MLGGIIKRLPNILNAYLPATLYKVLFTTGTIFIYNHRLNYFNEIFSVIQELVLKEFQNYLLLRNFLN